MQPPLAAGTVLQNRYRLLNMLGQGGFGRTYLAEDLGRFSERCALKELIPLQTGDYALEKSRELFVREATILYQIQHPQIPQFRATFEENQRLFLAQDYVEGKTYRDLLNERKTQGLTFSEAEVLTLMRQLLPVLAHIHAKGIIHRDISPDNIILRQADYLPVLIDFGVVKEIVTRVQAPGQTQAPTTVGKLGYAPSEQMQTGRAYPSSDLYSLAVTAVVLMTGREPQELYDDVNLTWYWQRYAPVSPGFAQVLNKMLNYRPGDRYQSVSELAQALQALTGATVLPPTMANPVPPVPPMMPTGGVPQGKPVAQSPSLSQMQTVAVGRRPVPVTQTPISHRHPDPIPSRRSAPTSVWDNPLAVLGIGLGLAVVTGIASWAVVSALLNLQSPPPTATPTPIEPTPTPSISVTPSPTSTPSPLPEQPVEFDQTLDLEAGATTTATGSLRANQTINYLVSLERGDELTATLDGEGIIMTVLAPDRQPADNRATEVLNWQGTADFTGDYLVQLKPMADVNQADYRLGLNLQRPEPTPEEPEPTPEEPAPDPDDGNTDYISFAPGQDNTEVFAQVRRDRTQRYLVQVEANQQLTVDLVQGDAALTLRSPDGQAIAGATNVSSAQLGPGLSPGAYEIEVFANQTVNFALRVSVTNP